MPSLADLPPEIFNIVLSYALDDDEDLQRLCGLSLLGRQWYSALVQRIYSEWVYNGAKQPFMTLWKFLITVLRDTTLAAQIRTLKVGNWGFFPEAATPGPDLQLPPDELDLVRGAIRDAGLGHLEGSILQALPKRDRRPLMALLLTSLPNLRTVFAHVPRNDPVLGAVLEKLVSNKTNETRLSPFLRELRELHLCQETPVHPPWVESDAESDAEEDSDDDKYSENRDSLRLDYLWPLLRHEPLRTVSLVDLDTKQAANWLTGSSVSHVEHLYLATIWKSLSTYPDIQALLAQPQALKSIALSLHDNPFDRRRNAIISNTELWDCLQKHQHTLESIDICRSKNTHRDQNGRFGLLRNFSNLKDLRIQPEVLLGGCCGEPRASFRLKDTLPQTLTTLTLYGEEGFSVISDLPAQLRELVKGPGFPLLSSIVLDDSLALFTDDGLRLRTPYRDLGQECTNRDIEFRVDEATNALGNVGGYRRLWGKTLDMQKDGEDRDLVASDDRMRLRDPQELILQPDHDRGDAKYRDPDELLPVGPRWRSADMNRIPFADHTGKTAYMVFESWKSIPLPPLFSFSVYFTHVNATPENTDMEALHRDLSPRELDLRFDMYFLPGATIDDCIAHYNGEKAARGSYKEQIRVFKTCPHDEIHPLPGTTGQIPGMVLKPYTPGPWRNLLFLLQDQNWRDAGLLQVRFDRKKLRGDGVDDEHQPAPPPPPPPPISVTRGQVRQDNLGYVCNSPGVSMSVGDTILEISPAERELYLNVWYKAMRRGWTTW
ncbi:uncharacterized protein BJX67DRAFT_377118 [Aspergillus lucknowensis]|uniref:F-box domain-containing protein n=1 Tax=Aspergillus lucknowensis TaxID=176173 RepID=A0ABR4M427_9EURO